jgi:hypothetical protein
LGCFVSIRLSVDGVRLEKKRKLRKELNRIDCPDQVFDLFHDARQLLTSLFGSLHQIGDDLWVLLGERSFHA